MVTNEKVDVIMTLVELSEDLEVNWELTNADQIVVDNNTTGFRVTFKV